MKKISFIGLITCALWTGCFSHTRNISSSPQYSHFIKKMVVTTEELRLHKADKHNYLFSEYYLSAFLSDTDYPNYKLLEVLPEGSTLKIVEARREFDSYGTWDYILGDYPSKTLGKTVRFEFPITIVEERRGKLPFKIVKKGMGDEK